MVPSKKKKKNKGVKGVAANMLQLSWGRVSTQINYLLWTFEGNISKLSVWASLIAQLVKNPPAIQETLVQFLGWEDLVEKG